MTRPTIFIKVIQKSSTRSRSTVFRGPDLGTVGGAGITVIRVGYRTRNVEGAGIVVVGLQESIFDLVLDTMGFVGGFYIHKGHGGGLTATIPVIFVVTEDFHALDPTEPEMSKNKDN